MSQIQRFFAVLFFSSLLAIAGCSKSDSSAGLEKPDTDGDGIADIYDPDIDGDGIPNGSDSDIDGDGIPNDQDPDMDGDGKPNGKDPDPENNDPDYCDRIQVFGLSEEQTTGSEIELTWYLQSSKTDGDCVVKEGVKADLIQVTASAVGADETKSEETNPLARAATRIQIPLACTGDTVEVTYDFTEIATLIKADPNAPGWTVKQRHKADPERCDIDGDGSPDFGPAQCPTGATGTYPSCSCPDGEGYDVSSNTCLDIGAGVGNLDCPISATGTYPSCTCKQGYKFNLTTNSCDVRPKTCEELGFHGGDDPYPPCTCGVDFPIWDQESLSCVAEPPLLGPGVETTCNGSVFVYTKRYIGTTYAQAWEQCAGSGSGLPSEEQIKEGCLDPYLKNPTSVWTSTVTQDGTEVRVLTQSWIEVDPTDLSKKFTAYCVQPKNPRPEFPAGTRADLDGDGTPNDRDPDIDGDGLTNDKDPDMDGDGTPNGSDPDVDGDGTPNTSDKDIDGDGIENKNDPDIDGDGIKNGIDKDSDGDGTSDAEDDTPGGPQ